MFIQLSSRYKIIIIYILGVLYSSLCIVFLKSYTFDIWDQQTWGYTAIFDNPFVVHIRNVSQSGVSVYGPIANVYIYIESFITLIYDIIIKKQDINLYTLSGTYIIIRKILLTLIHFLFSIFIYKRIIKSRKGLSEKKELIGLILWLFNPVVLLVSSIWGQLDEIMMILILLCLYHLYREHYTISSILLACSVLFKAQGSIVIPLYIFLLVLQILIRNKCKFNLRFLKDFFSLIMRVGLVFIFTFLLISFPYILFEKAGYFRNVFLNLRIFPFVHMKSFNLWMLIFGDIIQIEDNELILMNISYYILGVISFLLISLNLLLFILKKVIDGYDNISYSFILRILGIIYATFFIFMTEVHERYVVYFYIPYLIVFIIKFINTRIKLFEYIVFGIFTLVSSFNLLYVLYLKELVMIFDIFSLDIILRACSIIMILIYFSSLLEFRKLNED